MIEVAPPPHWVHVPDCGFWAREDAESSLRETAPAALAVGIFDGVHLGHRRVIDAARAAAEKFGGRCGVLTFEPHPSRLLRPEAPTRLLMAPETRTRHLLAAGVDFVLRKRFTPDFAKMEAETFVESLHVWLPTLRAIRVGANFRFGHHRRGDAGLLRREAAKWGIEAAGVRRRVIGGEAISSSRLREAIANGDMEAAAAMIGRPYASEGKVERGRQLGRKLKFPTLNLPWAPEAAPRFGVYCVEVKAGGGGGKDTRRAVANYGVRPTVGGGPRPVLEVHLLDGNCPFGEGDFLEVEWLRFMRPEMKFPDLETLRMRIAADVLVGGAWFDGRM